MGVAWGQGYMHIHLQTKCQKVTTLPIYCCILKTPPNKLCNNNITDVRHTGCDVAYICNTFCLRQDTTNQLIDGHTGKHKLRYPWADIALALCPHDIIKPLYAT